jgi:hypothetical protein
MFSFLEFSLFLKVFNYEGFVFRYFVVLLNNEKGGPC